MFGKVLTVLIFTSGFTFAQDKFPVLKGTYVGQKPPGARPEIFAEGIISLGLHEFGFVISPNGNEAFYTRTSKNHIIMHLKRKNDRWTAPEIAPFSGRYKDNCPRFSIDGKKVYFTSKRPLRDGNDFNIWMVERIGDTWSQSVDIGRLVNSKYNECNPSISANGNLYFQYFESSGLKSDLYYSIYKNEKYEKPVKLPDGINTEYNDAGPFIAPDERYLLFQSNRPGGKGYMDLYISYKEKDGSWRTPKNLGDKVNTLLSESNPYITPDQKYLFYSNYFGRNKGYIYWVDFGVLDGLKK